MSAANFRARWRRHSLAALICIAIGGNSTYKPRVLRAFRLYSGIVSAQEVFLVTFIGNLPLSHVGLFARQSICFRNYRSEQFGLYLLLFCPFGKLLGKNLKLFWV